MKKKGWIRGKISVMQNYRPPFRQTSSPSTAMIEIYTRLFQQPPSSAIQLDKKKSKHSPTRPFDRRSGATEGIELCTSAVAKLSPIQHFQFAFLTTSFLVFYFLPFFVGRHFEKKKNDLRFKKRVRRGGLDELEGSCKEKKWKDGWSSQDDESNAPLPLRSFLPSFSFSFIKIYICSIFSLRNLNLKWRNQKLFFFFLRTQTYCLVTTADAVDNRTDSCLSLYSSFYLFFFSQFAVLLVSSALNLTSHSSLLNRSTLSAPSSW